MTDVRRKAASKRAREAAATERSRSEGREEARDLAGGPEAFAVEPNSRRLDFTRRLRRLYEISKLLTHFEGGTEDTVRAVIEHMAQALPLRSAIFTLARESRPPRTIDWQAEGESAASLRAARAHARSAQRTLGRPLLASEADNASPHRAAPAKHKGNFIYLPLVIADRPIFGALQLEGVNPFDELDLVFVNAVVNQLAVAIDRQTVIDARQASTEAGAREQRLFADVSDAVGASLDFMETVSALARFVVPQLADFCIIDIRTENDTVAQCLVVKFADNKKQDTLAARIRRVSLPPGGRTPRATIIATGESVLVSEVTDPLADGIARNEEHAALMRATGLTSMLAVPLRIRGKAFGVLMLCSAESARRYTARDLLLAEEIARRAAVAIDNARLYAQAQQATRAREDLLAIVSHDLKNPLSVVLMNLNRLKRSTGDAGPGESKHVASIQRAAERMDSLISDLLETASIEAGHFSVKRRRLLLPPLVAETLEPLRLLAAGKSQTLESEVPDDLPLVFADAARVHQVLVNLLSNAMKFTPAGGTITLRARARDGEVAFSVTDTGPGIAAEHLPQLFTRFWQDERTARLGTGLGLFIVKGIVDAHGGEVWVDSTVGKGCTFHFTLPCEPPASGVG